MIIYLFAVAIKEPWGKKLSDKPKVYLGHGHSPTLGYSISLPRHEEIKDKTKEEIKEIIQSTKHSYKINKILVRHKAEIDYAEEYDDE